MVRGNFAFRCFETDCIHTQSSHVRVGRKMEDVQAGPIGVVNVDVEAQTPTTYTRQNGAISETHLRKLTKYIKM